METLSLDPQSLGTLIVGLIIIFIAIGFITKSVQCLFRLLIVGGLIAGVVWLLATFGGGV
jgi:uncharacterized BrkB/YihY/UPF0761 family membrane protein